MTLLEFLDALQPLARPAHDWIILGDSSICIRDKMNHDPINVLAHQLDPSFKVGDEMDDYDGTRAQKILNMTNREFHRLEKAVTGECSQRNMLRRQLLASLNMKEDW